MTGIGRRLLVVILGFSFCITFLLTGGILYDEYQRDLNNLNQDLEEHLIMQMPSFAHANWTMNAAIQKTLLNSLVKSRYIAYASLYDEIGNLILEVGQPLEKPAHSVEFPLIYTDNSFVDEFVGKIRVQVDNAIIFSTLKERLWKIVATQSVKTLLSSLFILYIIHLLISRHIYSIVQYVGNLVRKRAALPDLVLDRRPHNDELQQLVDSINHSSKKLNDYYKQLQKQRTDLRHEIKLRRIAEKGARNTAEQTNQILNALTDAVFSCSDDGSVLSMNVAAKLFINTNNLSTVDNKFKLHEALNISITEQFDNSHVDFEQLLMNNTEIKQINGYCQTNITNRNSSKKQLIPVNIKILPIISLQKDKESHQNGIIVVIRDESNTTKLAELSYNATHDFLTGTLNRLAFTTQLNKVLVRSKHESYCIAFVDLDHFKIINDTYGHSVGDKLLVQAAQVIKRHVQEADSVSRFGGDEFAIIFRSDIDKSLQIAKQILYSIENLEYHWRDRALLMSASIGITPIVPDDNFESAMGRADDACYRVKNDGGGAIQIQQAKFELDTPLDLFRNILHSLDQERLLLYAQPIVPLKSDLPKRLEILVRIDSGNDADPIILPGDFLPILDKYSYTPKIDLLVLEKTKSVFQKLVNNGWLLNINLSPLTLVKPVNIERILEFLELIDVRTGQLCFEITENVIFSQKEHVLKFMQTAREKGAIFALDDFGSGYASFGSLQNFNFEIIKLDGKLVRDLPKNEALNAVVKSIKLMADAMGAITVAEHVSSEDAIKILKEMQFDYVQSFYVHQVHKLQYYV